MRYLHIFTVLLVAGLVFPGCATIFTGTTDEITIESEPPGARIFIDGIEYGRTPDTIIVNRAGISDRSVTLRLDGYEPHTFRLDEEFNAVFIVNIFFWPGFIVDVATGAVTRYRPLGYYIDLEPEGRVHQLDALPRDAEGRYLLPSNEGRVIVQDVTSGAQVVFEK